MCTTSRVFKFGYNDSMKFIGIYHKHECLWDTEHTNYKNRDARNAALRAFAEELGLEGFGPTEITMKIKNLRTQYMAETKKVRESVSSGCDSEDVYKPKLAWYDLMDSFLRKLYDSKDTASNSKKTTDSTQLEDDNLKFEYVESLGEEFTDEENSNDQIQEVARSTPTPEVEKRSRGFNFMSNSNKIDRYEKRLRLERQQDELDDFGKYVVSTLRNLKRKNCIYAQDEIQKVLSKFKLQDMHEN